ncbi:hypothetical protein [Halorubrum sp. Boch-26]|uniref:hypothetical protein n=1 Tax=Halorubrum sp. Boch-26 TaxID=2994426 RepID=UPI00246826F4|nr:hypothetical protein [Halorubrum sp. Boch-26]
MNRRRFLAGLGTGTAVGIAGCSGDEGSVGPLNGGPDRPFADADWRDGDGLALGTLAEAHTGAFVDAGGFTLFSTAETSHDGGAEPAPWLPSQTYESGYDIANGRQYVRQEITETSEADVTELYVADGELLFRRRADGETQYDRQSADRSAADLEDSMRQEALTGIRVEGETETGETRYEGLNRWNPTSDGEGQVRGERTARFTADAFDGDRNIPETVETASATAYVYEAGVVPRLEQSWAGEHDGRGATVDVDIDYRDPGAEIPEPDWAADAREATSE